MARSHPRRSPLPEEFWTAAVELALRHGVYRTARALPIDYANLRKRLGGVAQPETVTRPQLRKRLVNRVPAGPQLVLCGV